MRVGGSKSRRERRLNFNPKPKTQEQNKKHAKQLSAARASRVCFSRMFSVRLSQRTQVYNEGDEMKARYRVHRFDVVMRRDQARFEQFLNSLEGEVVAVIPSVSPSWTFGGMGARTHYFWVIERVAQS